MREGLKASVQSERWRDKPYVKFENEIKKVQEVESILSQNESGGGNLVSEMEEYYQEQLRSLPGCKEKLTELLALRTQIEDIEGTLEHLDEEDDSYVDLVEELFRREDSGNRRIAALETDPDVAFFSRIQRGIELLRLRSGEVEECRTNPVLQYRGAVVPFEDAHYTSVSATYIVNDAIWKELIKSRSRGFHITGTVINIVKANPDKQQEARTIRHENKHALFDIFFEDQTRTFGVKEAERALAPLLKDKDAPEKAWFKLRLDQVQHRISEAYLSDIKTELIANFEGLAEGSVSSDFTIYQDLFAWLSKTEEENEGPIQDALRDTRERLKAECQRFYLQLSDVLFSADKEGLLNDVHSAMLLLNPLDYKKIEQYLIWKIGKEKYETHQALRRIICAPFFFVSKQKLRGRSALSKLVSLMESFTDPFVQAATIESSEGGLDRENVERISFEELEQLRLSDTDKEALKRKVSNLIVNNVSNFMGTLKEEEPPYVSGYLDKVARLCQFADPSIDREEFRKQAWAQYICDKLDPLFSENDSESARQIILLIPDSEKGNLSEAAHALREFMEDQNVSNDENWQSVLQLLGPE